MPGMAQNPMYRYRPLYPQSPMFSAVSIIQIFQSNTNSVLCETLKRVLSQQDSMDVPSTSATPRSEKRSRSDRSARNLAHDEDSSDSPRRGPNPFISNPLAHPQFQPQRLGARGVSSRPILLTYSLIDLA